MKTKILTVALILTSCLTSFAQIQTPGWNWPEDRKTAEEKYVLYTDMYNLGSYKEAVPPMVWLMTNAPNLHSSLYINGAKIYENLADAEKDEAQKTIYEDSCLLMYDLRIQYFNEEAQVLNRKAYYAYKFKNDDSTYSQKLYDLFKRTFELNGNNFSDNNLVAYMDVVRRYKLNGGKISDEEVLAIYESITNVVDYKKSQGLNVEKLDAYAEQIDKLLTTIVQVDCNFIENNLGPKLKENQDDIKLAKNIFKLSFAGKCMDSPIFLLSAMVVQKHEPTYGMAKLIGDRCYLIEDFEKALRFYKEAITLTDENVKKADLYLKIGDIYSKNGQKTLSRDYARMCLSSDPSKSECYTLIGNLYFNSYNDCKQGVNPIEDRAVYIAAYEMYKKAGNSDAMSSARQQFPTMEEIFTFNMELGQPIKVGCWINEVVTIQKRD